MYALKPKLVLISTQSVMKFSNKSIKFVYSQFYVSDIIPQQKKSKSQFPIPRGVIFGISNTLQRTSKDPGKYRQQKNVPPWKCTVETLRIESVASVLESIRFVVIFKITELMDSPIEAAWMQRWRWKSIDEKTIKVRYLCIFFHFS